MSGYKRNISDKIDWLLNHFPVVAIVGVRQAGKTTLLRQLRPDWLYIDLENTDDFYQLSMDTVFYFKKHPQDIAIDEAQLHPELFQVLRGVIDARRDQAGRFMLSGSSSFALLDNILETLAGRIAVVEVGTLKMNEYYNDDLSSFYNIFAEKLAVENVPNDTARYTHEQVHKCWLEGGYPEVLLKDNFDLHQQWMEQYRDAYIHRDIARQFPKLNKLAYQRFIFMLSQLSGTIINRSQIARAVSVSEKTIREYMEIVAGTFIWRNLPSYEKNIKKSIVKMPKGYIRDTGLLHFLLKITSLEDLYYHPQVSASFESFVIEEICKGLSATRVANWGAYFYRTRNGAEIDLILDGPFGVLPIEIKQGSRITLKQIQTLSQFVKEHNLSFGMVVNQSERIEWLTEKIVCVPVGCL